MSLTDEPTAPERRGGIKHRWVFAFLAVVALLILGVFGAGYFLLIHYERNAARHIPEHTRWVVRVDVEKIVLFEPFRRHVLQALKSGPDEAKSASWLSRFEKASEVNVALELREVVYARTADDWVLALGGTYSSAGIVRHAYEAMGDAAGCQLTRGLLRCPKLGVYAAQADDGTVLIASDEKTLNTSLAPSDRYQMLGLPREGPGGFAVHPSVLAKLANSPLSWMNRDLKRLADVGAFYGELSLEENVHVVATLQPRDQASLAPLVKDADSLLGVVRKVMAFAPGPDFAGERAILSRAALSANEQGWLLVRSHWKRSEVEQAARSIAGLLRQHL